MPEGAGTSRRASDRGSASATRDYDGREDAQRAQRDRAAEHSPEITNVISGGTKSDDRDDQTGVREHEERGEDLRAIFRRGHLYGVLAAVGLSVAELLLRVGHPHDAIQDLVPGLPGMHDVDDYPQAELIPGLVVYRYDAPLFFANAGLPPPGPSRR